MFYIINSSSVKKLLDILNISFKYCRKYLPKRTHLGKNIKVHASKRAEEYHEIICYFTVCILHTNLDVWYYLLDFLECPTQPELTCSKLIIETLKQGIKNVQS